MPSCELCGKPVLEKKMITVDGTVFSVCLGCAKHGKPYNPAPLSARKKAAAPAPAKKIAMRDETMLDPEFPRLIREARMKKGLSHEQLGMQMNEKAALLKRFETGVLKPDEIFARKLERHLGIKLYIAADDAKKSERFGFS